MMTYRCNLDCKYCYIHTKRDRHMTLEMAQSILEPFLQKKQGELQVTFMGGETLLAMDVIKPLVEWVESQHWGRTYRFLGATNGTLLNDNLKEWLSEHKHILTLGLSYDGLPNAQRSNRGNDTIDLEFFIQTWPQQPLQMTVTAYTVNQMADGVIYLLEKGAKVHPNVAYERVEWPQAKIVEYAKQLDKLIEYYRTHEDKPLITQLIHNLSEYAHALKHPAPQFQICGAGNGFQVFDTDGRSYPCHILSPLVLEGRQLQEIQGGLFSKTKDFSDSDCSSCPFASSCPTCLGCNYVHRGQLQKRDKTHCLIMKKEVKAFIKKEVIRLKEKKQLTAADATVVDAIRELRHYEARQKAKTILEALQTRKQQHQSNRC